MKVIRIRTFIVPLILTSVVFLTIYFTTGFHYEEGTDSVMKELINNTFKGTYDNIINTFGFHVYISYIYAYLAHLTGGVLLYDYFMLSYIFLATVFMLFLLARLIPKVEHKWTKCMLIVFFIFLWVENILLIQSTRIAFLLGATSLLVIVDFFVIQKRKVSSYPGLYFLLNTTFIIALLTRVEPVILMLALLIPFVVIWFQRLIEVKSVLLTLIPALAISILISILINIPFNKEDKEYLSFRPYQFTLWDFEQPNKSPFLITQEDSIKYNAAKSAFLTDRNHLNPDFFERIQLNKMDKTPIYFKNYIQDKEGFKQKLRKFLRYLNHKILLVLITLIVTGFLITKLFRQPLLLWRFMGFQALFWIVVFIVALFMKMEDRVFVPMIDFNILSSVLFVHRRISFTGKIKSISLIIILIIIAGFQIINVINKVKDKKAQDYYKDLMIVELNNRFIDKIVIMDLLVFDRLHIQLPKKLKLSPQNTYVAIDNAILFMYKTYDGYMYDLTNKRDLLGYIQFLKERAEDVVFVSTPDRVEFLQDYMTIIYSEQLQLERLSDEFNDSFNSLYFRPELDKSFYKIAVPGNI